MDCPICHRTNHHLATVCTSCGGYIRNKVDNLDLFAIMGMVLLSPRQAMERIALATHKNYMVLLSSMGGIGVAFLLMTVMNTGEIIGSLQVIAGAGIAGGIFLGILISLFIALCLVLGGKAIGTRVRFRDAFATVGYSFVPVNLSVVFLLPIEIMTYGLFLFTREPSAYSLNPTSFILFSVLDGILGIWTLWLYFIGVRVISNSTRLITAIIGVIPILFLAAIVATIWLFLASDSSGY